MKIFTNNDFLGGCGESDIKIDGQNILKREQILLQIVWNTHHKSLWGCYNLLLQRIDILTIDCAVCIALYDYITVQYNTSKK